MDLFWKAAALALIVMILGLAVGKQEKDLGILLSAAGCVLICLVALHYLESVLDLLYSLEALGNFPDNSLEILLKALGIGMTSEIASIICTDGGNSSLGKTIQLTGCAAILYLAIPVFHSLIALIQELLSSI